MGCVPYLVLFVILTIIGVVYPVIFQVIALLIVGMIVLGVCAVLFWMFILMPLQVRKTLSQPMKPRLVPFEFGRDLLLPDVQAFFAKYESRFEAMGFRLLERFFFNPGAMGVRTAVVLFINDEGHFGQLVGMIGMKDDKTPQDDESLRNIYFEFTTEFSNDTSVYTNTSQSLGCFPENPDVLKLFCLPPGTPETLYEIHCGVVAAVRGSREILKLSDETAYVEFVKWAAKSLDHPIKKGYFKRDEKAQMIHATLKGTFLMTWTQTPGIVGRLTRRNAERNRQLLTTWGMGGLLKKLEGEAGTILKEISEDRLRQRWAKFRTLLVNRCAELGYPADRIRIIPRPEAAKLDENRLTITFDGETMKEEDLVGLEGYEERFIISGRAGYVMPVAELLAVDRASGLLYITLTEYDEWRDAPTGGDDASNTGEELPPAYRISEERFQKEPVSVEFIGTEAPKEMSSCQEEAEPR